VDVETDAVEEVETSKLGVLVHEAVDLLFGVLGVPQLDLQPVHAVEAPAHEGGSHDVLVHVSPLTILYVPISVDEERVTFLKALS